MLIGIIPMLTAFASLITGIGYNYETDPSVLYTSLPQVRLSAAIFSEFFLL